MKPCPRRLRALLLAAVTVAVVIAAAPASAHTGFDSSEPGEGAAVDGPLEAITLEFTGQALSLIHISEPTRLQ